MPPYKVKTYYKSLTMPGLAILIHKGMKRAPQEYQIYVNWYRFEDKLKKWVSMEIDQDIVIKDETFGKEWRELAL